MSLTNFPNGVTSFGVPVIGSGGQIPSSTGSYFFVHSGTGNAGNAGKTTKKPMATIDQAINKCTANKGDVIIVMPGHAEVLGAAGAITADVAGITIVGLGVGTSRPKLTFSAATSTFIISAANVTIDNLYLDMADTVDAVAQAFDVGAANCTIKNVDVLMSTVTYQATSCIITDVNCGNLKVLNCKFLAPDVGANEAINLTGVTDGVEIKNCVVAGDFAVAPIHNPTGNVLTNLLISDCVLKNDQAGDFALELVSASTGFLVRNFYHTSALATAVDPGACFSLECYACHGVDKNGLLTPAVDS